MRVLPPEDLMNLLGVLVILGKDDCLSELFAIINAQAIIHQNVKHLPNGILVKHPLIDGGRCNAFGQFTICVFKGVFICFLISVGKIVVNDTLLDEFQLAFHRHKVDKESIGNCLPKLITICRNTVFKLENLICVLVDLILGRSGKTHQRCVEVIENILVLIVDRTVRLIHNYKIEMSDGKELLLILVLDRIDAIHHRLIGREYATRIKVFLILTEIGYRQIR